MGFFQNLTGWHALILLAVVLLLFGAAKLPALARSAGQSMRIFRSESKERDAPGEHTTGAEAATESPSSTPSGRGVVTLGERSASS